jgi:hypothetical protein
MNTAAGFPILPLLCADGPWPGLRDELMLFGQFVGAWDMQVEFYSDDGECVYRQPGQWSFAWVLDGRVIQDVLTYPGAGEASRGIGTSIRYYDPASRRWQVIWLGAVTGITVILHGGKRGDEILLEGPDPDGTLNQWMFTDITDSSFTWTGLESADQGTTWHLRQRMTGTRSQVLGPLHGCAALPRAAPPQPGCWDDAAQAAGQGLYGQCGRLARSLIMAASDASSVPTSARIEALLSASYDTPVRVRAVDRLEPWFVLRCHLTARAPGVPASVVVKWLRDTPGDMRKDPAQLHTEQAALEFAAELDPALAPRLLAADTALPDPRDRILVLEDLAPRKPLREVLLGEGPERSAGLLKSFARALARLHAASAGQSDAYYSRRSRLGPVDPQADIERFLGDWRAGAQRMADAGVAMTTAAMHELAGIVTELASPSAFLAFSNGDPGVNNYLVGAHGDGRLIDFESAGFRHAICDLVNDLYIPGPMWLTVGDPLSNGIEEAYRNTLAQAVPEVTDDHWFGRAVSGAGFTFAAGRLRALARLDARPSGDNSRLNRIAALEAAADTAKRHHCLPHLTAWARAAAENLRRRWPDADIDLNALEDYTTRR